MQKHCQKTIINFKLKGKKGSGTLGKKRGNKNEIPPAENSSGIVNHLS